MAAYLLQACIFFISWTGAFALTPWLRLHFLVVLGALAIATISIALRGRFSTAPYKSDDYWIAFFLLAYILSALVNLNDSSFAYVTVYLYVLLGLYLFLKGALFTFLSSRQIYLANLYGVAFVGAFLSINFILNIAGIADLQGMMPRLRDTTATYAGVFVRGYGFSTEPGIVAYYMNTLGPLAVWYLWSEIESGRSMKLIVTFLIAFGWIVTFSAGGVFMLALSFLLSTLIIGIRKKRVRVNFNKLINLVALSVVFVIGVMLIPKSYIYQLLHPMYMKFSFSEELNTVTERIDRYEAGYAHIIDKPFLGHGPGYFSSVAEGSTLNWYLMLIAESGLISIIPIIIFFCLVLIRIVRFQHPFRFAILVGFISACGHLMLMTTSGYLHPFLWLLIAIFYVQLARHHENISLGGVPRAKITHPA